MIVRFLAIFLFLPFIGLSQSLTGKVIDKKSKTPVESASVYFDNTTVGTTTNKNGAFSIEYSDAIQSALVISYLGYQKVVIKEYRNIDSLVIKLIEAPNTLDEVHLEYDDGLTRRQKLNLFRKNFLGTSKFGKSCEILNEQDLILKYDGKNKSLYASSKAPIKILNQSLQYEIEYELVDFEIKFKYVNPSSSTFTLHSVVFYGTTFYKDLLKKDSKGVLKRREKAYKGSIQRFMRALYNKNLHAEGYAVFFKGFPVNEWDFFKVLDVEDSVLKNVSLKQRVSLLYAREVQSDMELVIADFFVDKYGNYWPIDGIFFSGDMGDQRVGDSLPSDYGLIED